MTGDLAYARRFREAIEDFWLVRGRQGVRSGRHLDKLAELVGDIFVDEGFAEGNVLRRRQLEIPGYYRSEKRWDLLVVYKNVLAAAIEFKSQVGSVGKNINNRAEEAVGSATDVWAAHREGRYGLVRPWLGYVLLLEDTPEIRKPVSTSEPFFPVDEVFQETSYKDRYEIFCRRLLDERLYDAACFVALKRDAADPLEEPASDLSFAAFASAIRERARVLAALREEL
jgi:hypothetical protein